jgi:hypothetical protein
VDGNGKLVACVATAANVNDTLVFKRLFLAAFAAMARIRTLSADKGYDTEPHRALCRWFKGRRFGFKLIALTCGDTCFSDALTVARAMISSGVSHCSVPRGDAPCANHNGTPVRAASNLRMAKLRRDSARRSY